jgi:CHASE1-domain containing sensor protein
MRNVVWLIRGYAAVSLLTLVAMIVFRNDTAMVTAPVWIRGTLVAASSLLTLFFATRAARGDRRMLRRLRIVTVVMLIAIMVIIALPGTFPLWLKLEQGICGVLLLAAVPQIIRRTEIRP